MIYRGWRFLLLTTMLPLCLGAQSLDVGASRDDWEEINFEYKSTVLTDGYPSLLRLAELIKKNPGYKVKLVGHGDDRGSNTVNDKLGARRAEAVKAFLVKYGANPAQIETSSQGKRSPRTSGRTPEARFVNRRVNVTVTDPSGKVIGDGGINDAIESLQKTFAAVQKKQEECCDAILKRLDRLDEIASMLRDMKSENAGLRKELDALKSAQSNTDASIKALPKPLTSSEVTSITERSATDALVKERLPRFSLLGVNAGVDQDGKLTFTGKGRFFAPLRESFALQAQAEYLYFRDRKEGQFDLGMVSRYRDFQAGLFTSFKNVQLNDLKAGGTLGQGALTLDYIFGRGKVGLFGTKAFLDNVLLQRTLLTRTIAVETLLKAVDQIGAQTTLGLWKNVYLEGNLGYLKSYGSADRPGGTLRFVFPLSDRFAFTLEGGMNETMLGRDNNGRVVAGIQMGNFLRPKEYKASAHPIPADVPRVRYEVLTRRVRIGNDAPIADAGPDQIGVQAGPITLDGSNSSDPEGDPITFQWTQTGGPTASIAGANTARATFTAAEGASYSFRLAVTDDKGAQSVARVNVTVARTPQVRILRFVASPQQIRAGESSTLSWSVENADTVTIDGIGNVNAGAGTTNVAPQETTVYRLTATNRQGSVSETVTVSVTRPDVRILFFSASPMTVVAGQSSTLSWQTENAEQVEISGIGAVAQSGSVTVTPTANTTYVITARNRFSSTTSTSQIAIQVVPAPMPRIVRFTAAPAEIVTGESASLVWQVENATDVSITTVGEAALTGSTTVTPTATTTYVITARNASGEASAQTTVTVFPQVRIVSFTATPTASQAPGSPVVLTWTTEGANEVVLDGVGAVAPNGSATVNPQIDTEYTLRAFGRRGSTTAKVQVTVRRPTPTGGPIANAGPDQTTTNRDIRLDGTRSFHPEGLVIGYSWRAVGRQPELILGGDTATPTVRFAPLAFGEYVFELTVTDSQGRFSKSTTKVFFAAY